MFLISILLILAMQFSETKNREELWISVLSPRAIVTVNCLLTDIMTGKRPKQVVLLSEIDSGQSIVKAVSELCKLWLNYDVTVEIFKFNPLDEEILDRLEKTYLNQGDKVLVNITPGRKIDALRLYAMARRHGCSIRYHYLVYESLLGYRPFALAPFDTIIPLNLNTWKPSNWNPPQVGADKSPVRLNLEETCAFINILPVYTRSRSIQIKVGEPFTTAEIIFKVIKPGMAKINYEISNREIMEALNSACIMSEAIEPRNIDNLAKELAKLIRSGYEIIPDTNTLMDRITSQLERKISAYGIRTDTFRESITILRVVYNELSQFERMSDRGINEDQIRLRKRFLGLREMQRLGKCIPEPPSEKFTRARGDDMLIEEIKARLGRKPKAVLITEDMGLSRRAKLLLDTKLIETPDVKEGSTIPTDAIPKIIYFMTILTPNVVIKTGNVEVKLKFSKRELIERDEIRAYTDPKTAAIANKIKKTLEIEKELLRP